MASSIDHAIRIGNEGVTLLLSGQNRDAAALMTAALEVVKREVNHNEGTVPLVTFATPDVTGFEQAASSAGLHGSSSSFHVSSPLPNLQDEHYFIYNRTITILSSAPRSPHMLHVYAACMVLNLALAHHRSGRQGNFAALRKAEIMYELAVQLVAADMNVANKCATAVLVHVAALNNLSLLRFDQGNDQRARDGFKQLCHLVFNEDILEGVFNESETKLLLLNGMLVAPYVVAPAA